MATQPAISADEAIFLRRALPHLMAGKSIEDSLRAVLDDDARLFNAFHNRGSSHFSPTPDERGVSYYDGAKVGDAIAAEITSRVYHSCRSQVAL